MKVKEILDFNGLQKKVKPKDGYPGRYLCPVCKGYGGWVLERDAYGKGRHFQASCSQCNGWGWVNKEDKKCIHNYKEIWSTRDCRHGSKCMICGKEIEIDSSG